MARSKMKTRRKDNDIEDMVVKEEENSLIFLKNTLFNMTAHL